MRDMRGEGEAGIKFVTHLRCLGGKRYAVEQLICMLSRKSAVEVKDLSYIPGPIGRRKMRRYNSK